MLTSDLIIELARLAMREVVDRGWPDPHVRRLAAVAAEVDRRMPIPSSVEPV